MKALYFNKLIEKADNADNVVIISHKNPDGDAVGSALALSLYLAKKGIANKIILPDPFPAFYNWMPGAENIQIFMNNPKTLSKTIKETDLLIGVDFSDLDRTGSLKPVTENLKCDKALIDHHIQPSLEEFDLVFSDTQFSSTAELLLHLIKEVGDEELVDKDIATALFVGIMTDTGSFSFQIDRPETFKAASFLTSCGISPDNIHKAVYDNNSADRLKLLGYALYEKLVVLPEYNTAYISLDKAELEKFNYTPGDTEGLVNFALSIAGVHMAALFTERESVIRCSFRSKGAFSVNDFSRNHFNGGGHFNAAGGSSKVSMKETLDSFVSVLPDYKEELKNATNS